MEYRAVEYRALGAGREKVASFASNSVGRECILWPRFCFEDTSRHLSARFRLVPDTKMPHAGEAIHIPGQTLWIRCTAAFAAQSRNHIAGALRFTAKLLLFPCPGPDPLYRSSHGPARLAGPLRGRRQSRPPRQGMLRNISGRFRAANQHSNKISESTIARLRD